jgi:hypothetical protein
LLRPRCDARGFEPLLIEIIAERERLRWPLNHGEIRKWRAQGRKAVTTPA